MRQVIMTRTSSHEKNAKTAHSLARTLTWNIGTSSLLIHSFTFADFFLHFFRWTWNLDDHSSLYQKSPSASPHQYLWHYFSCVFDPEKPITSFDKMITFQAH
jgi:hypothetical protein